MTSSRYNRLYRIIKVSPDDFVVWVVFVVNRIKNHLIDSNYWYESLPEDTLRKYNGLMGNIADFRNTRDATTSIKQEYGL